MIQDKNNIEEKVVDYWTKRVADFSDVRENELDSELSREWVDNIMQYISPLIDNGQNVRVLEQVLDILRYFFMAKDFRLRE